MCVIRSESTYHYLRPLMSTYQLLIDDGEEITEKQSKDAAAVDPNAAEEGDQKGEFCRLCSTSSAPGAVHLAADIFFCFDLLVDLLMD